MTGARLFRAAALVVVEALLVGGTTARAQEPLVKVTWQQAIERVLTRNPTAVVAAQEIERASALVREARASWLPTLSANGSYTHVHADGITPDIKGANLQLTVPIVAPTAWMNDSHAGDNREVVRSNATDIGRQLAAAAGRAYLAVLLQHRQVEVADRARETAAAHYDYAHTRLEHGIGNGIDDARAEQELRTTEVTLKNAQSALVRAQSALAILLSEATLVDIADEVALASPPTVEQAMAAASGQRSDVRVAQTRRLATEHLRRDDWVYYAPTLLAQAQAFDQTKTSLQLGKGWEATLVLSIPLFDGGFRYGVQRERRALDEEARAQLDGLLRQVSVEVRATFAVLRTADESLVSARAAVNAALRAAALADKSYRAGATTNIEVVDAQRQARDAESQAALAEDGARQARLDLLIATGAFP
ncbi:MAG TPA: TolC family protein [Polyangia bacterium]|nr:TolC family protein [Polyangia bacterium]